MALISPMHPTWNRSSRFSPRCENFCTTLSTSRRLPSIIRRRAARSPARAAVSRARFSSSERTGSPAVSTPHSSTLLYILCLPVSIYREYGPAGPGPFMGNGGPARAGLLLFQLAAQVPDDPLFQPGNVALADTDGVGGLFLGVLHPVHQAEAQLHDLALPGAEPLHRPAQHRPLGVLLQALAHLVLVGAQHVRKQQLVAVAVHVERLVDAGLLAAAGSLAQVHQDLVADAAAGVGGQLDVALGGEGVHRLDEADGPDGHQVLGGHPAGLVLFGQVDHQP